MTSFDVESIKNRMISRLQSKQSWKDILFYSTNLILVETFAEALHNVADFNTYLTIETKWALAQNRTSLLASQDLHNYQAKRKLSSRGSLRISTSETFDGKHTQDITIQKYTQFKTSDDIKFLSRNVYILDKNSNYIDIDVIQGEYITNTFTATGTINEIISIDSTDIENDSIEVYINGFLWTQTRSIYEEQPDAFSYQLIQDLSNNTVKILFGDGIFGRRLTSGDVIRVDHINTIGDKGNIAGAGVITEVVSNIRDITGASVDLYCNNIEAILGGRDEEQLESIRSNATNYFQTGDRAVSTKDYETLILLNAPYISKIQVWGVYEYNIDNNRDMWDFLPSDENLVNVCALNLSYENLSQFQKDDISTFLLDKKSPTDILKFQDANPIDMLFFIDAYVTDKSYLLNMVKNDIQNALDTNYGLGKTNFFQHIYFSDYIRLIDEVPGVDHHNTKFKIQEYLDFEDAYVVLFGLALYPLQLEGLEVWIKDISADTVFKIGEDNRQGNIVGVTGFDLTGSNITYSNGVGNLAVVSGLSKSIEHYKIFIRYKIENNNAILNDRRQILIYNSLYSEINTFYKNNK